MLTLENDKFKMWGAIGFIGCLLLIVMLAILMQPQASEAGAKDKAILYFAADFGLNSDPFLELEEVSRRNIIPVQSFLELKALEDTQQVGAIIIHKTRLDDLDEEWIQDVYSHGTVVAGLNVTIKELALVVDDQMVLRDPVWADGWQREPYFSVLSYKPNGDEQEQALAKEEGKIHATISHTTDNISDNDFGIFFYIIDRDMRMLEGEE